MVKVLKESEVADHIPEVITKGRWYLFCPGCLEAAKAEFPDEPNFWAYSCLHCFSDSVHQFNGDVENPTLSPSLLVSGGERRCHSFVKDGMIQFLSDCTHPLANQTVALLDAQIYLDAEAKKSAQS